jgi:hypothetical protein
MNERERSDLSKWITEHRCRYEIQPVIELSEGATHQVGFELSLYAELPVGETIAPELGRDLDAIRDRLGDILESLVPTDARARIERVPFRRAVRFLHGGRTPLVTQTVRIFHPDYSDVQPGDREKFRPTEKRLLEMGFRRA